jgi:hypothetical protein
MFVVVIDMKIGRDHLPNGFVIRAQRRRRLKGATEFREDRVDLPKAKGK